MEPTILTSGLFDRVNVVRRTVYRLALALLGATLLAYPFAAQLLHIVQLPLHAPLIIYAPLEGFMGYIKVSVATGVLIISPLIFYEIKRFLETVCRMPHKMAVGGTVASGGLFLLGVVFCYAVMMPVTLGFLLSYGGDTIAAGISVSKYLALALTLAAVCGVMFELPLVTFVLHRLGLISITFLTENRRYAVLIAAVVTAILTPTPDAFTMTLLLVPLLALYEVSILVLRVVERHPSHADED